MCGRASDNGRRLTNYRTKCVIRVVAMNAVYARLGLLQSQLETTCVAKPSVSPPDAQPRRILPEVDFDHCTTSAVPQCISLPSFSAIERCAAELLRFYWWRPKLHHGSRRGVVGTLPNFSWTWTHHRSYVLLNGFKFETTAKNVKKSRKNRVKILRFLTPAKIRGRVGRADSTGWTCVDRTGMSLMSIWLTSWLEPSHMTCVFAGFNRSLLAWQTSKRSDRQYMQWMSERLLWCCRADSDAHVAYTWLSSTYWCSFIPWSSTTRPSSAVYKTCNSGPSTDPCGTPNSSWWTGDSWPPYSTCCVLSARKNCSHRRTVPVRPQLNSIIIIFVYYNCSQTAQSYSTNIRHAGRETTAATQGSTIYRRVKPAKLLPHTAHSDWINRTGLTSWAFTRWCDRHTSDKVAHYSIYWPRKDERLSWPWVAFWATAAQLLFIHRVLASCVMWLICGSEGATAQLFLYSPCSM